MQDAEYKSAFGFKGTWREFAPIAFTNLLLTIVTLGIYRFWATTRERKYLWSRSRFIDDRLEWTGTGMELFIGFLLVLVLFGIPFFALGFLSQILILQGSVGGAALLNLSFFGLLFYLVGFARFRALRYRLSRTYWHGIRGGSDDGGFRYGLSYIWKTLVGTLAAGLMVPWSMVSLWNERWNGMSFGPHRFESAAEHGSLMKRYLLFYLLPIAIFISTAVIGLDSSATDADIMNGGKFALIALSGLAFYLAIGLIATAFYAKYFRVVVEGLSLNSIGFHFSASTKAWLKLILGDVALVILTLGIGWIFLSYRHWKFFITHMEATGEIDLNALTQSETRTPTQGEGLLDAFDVGAI